MTLDAIREFGITVEEKDSLFSISGIEDFTGKDLRIEGDWSNAAFWLCAGAMGGKRYLRRPFGISFKSRRQTY